MFARPLPRYVIAKTLASGVTAFYFNIPTLYRKQGCAIANEPLGGDYVAACGEDGEGGRAASLNALFDEWDIARHGGPSPSGKLVRYGTVSWLFREYKRSKAYLEKVSNRSRPDYERIMLLVTELATKKGDEIGDRSIRAITPRSADKIYDLICSGPSGERPRQAEKAVVIAGRAWDVVRRLYPDLFDKNVPNPWRGVTKRTRARHTKPAVTRELVYAFAWGCLERGHPEPAAAAVICFEWLQRPENVLEGHLSWPNYRGREQPDAIKIFHHKTGAVVLHPLEESTGDGLVQFYTEAEAVLAKLPRRGVPMILRERRDGTAGPFKPNHMAKLVRKLAGDMGLPATFTLDACRHGGMTELEEAALTDGQGRALSAHRSQRTYQGYAKRTFDRALAATRKRHAHRLANAAGTSIQNEQRIGIQNENGGKDADVA
jgi:hypothetical protein